MTHAYKDTIILHTGLHYTDKLALFLQFFIWEQCNILINTKLSEQKQDQHKFSSAPYTPSILFSLMLYYASLIKLPAVLRIV